MSNINNTEIAIPSLHCGACRKPYDQPRHLPMLLQCNHSVCAACVQLIEENCARKGRQTTCPICQHRNDELFSVGLHETLPEAVKKRNQANAQFARKLMEKLEEHEHVNSNGVASFEAVCNKVVGALCNKLDVEQNMHEQQIELIQSINSFLTVFATDASMKKQLRDIANDEMKSVKDSMEKHQIEYRKLLDRLNETKLKLFSGIEESQLRMVREIQQRQTAAASCPFEQCENAGPECVLIKGLPLECRSSIEELMGTRTTEIIDIATGVFTGQYIIRFADAKMAEKVVNELDAFMIPSRNICLRLKQYKDVNASPTTVVNKDRHPARDARLATPVVVNGNRDVRTGTVGDGLTVRADFHDDKTIVRKVADRSIARNDSSPPNIQNRTGQNRPTYQREPRLLERKFDGSSTSLASLASSYGGSDGRKIFVSNLPLNVGYDELNEYFGQVGRVARRPDEKTMINILPPTVPTRRCVIEYEDEESADHAVRRLHKTILPNSHPPTWVGVTKYRRAERQSGLRQYQSLTTKICVSNVKLSTPLLALNIHFGTAGEIAKDSIGKSKIDRQENSGGPQTETYHIEYVSPESARNAVRTLDKTALPDSLVPMRVSYLYTNALPRAHHATFFNCKRIFVKNLPLDATEKTIAPVFSKLAPIAKDGTGRLKIKLWYDQGQFIGKCIIEYESEDKAELMVRMMHNKKFPNSDRLLVVERVDRDYDRHRGVVRKN